MKNSEFLKNEIKSCSRCGLCMAVCPVYQVTKNDCVSPRGKIILINELLKKNIKPSKKMKQYIKMCINCEKCIDFCPNKINTTEINNVFNKNYPLFSFNITNLPILIRYFFNLTIKIFEHKNIDDKKSIVYVMSYHEKEIPKEIQNKRYEIFNDCGIPIEFAFSNPKIYKALSIISVKKILKNNPDFIFTNNPLCRTQIQTGLKLLKIKKSVYYI